MPHVTFKLVDFEIRYSTQGNYDQYKKDYVKLYIDTVRAQFERIAGGKGVFVSSSPSNGNLTESEGWVGQSPGNQYWGDGKYFISVPNQSLISNTSSALL